MTTLLLSLLAFVAWTLILLNALLLWRGVSILRGKKINEFPSGERHGSDAYWRLNRAHTNCLENLPVFGALTVIAVAMSGTTLPAILYTAAKIVPGARVLQSLAHLSGGGAINVTTRFLAFYVQIACFVVMAGALASVML